MRLFPGWIDNIWDIKSAQVRRKLVDCTIDGGGGADIDLARFD